MRILALALLASVQIGGIFGYPSGEACQVIVDTCRRWLESQPGSLEEIRLVGYDDGTVGDFRQAAGLGTGREEPESR